MTTHSVSPSRVGHMAARMLGHDWKLQQGPLMADLGGLRDGHEKVTGEAHLTPEQTAQAVSDFLDEQQAKGYAENAVVVQDLLSAFIGLAAEREVWGPEPGVGVTDADMFARIDNLIEKARQARAAIRWKYKVDLL